MTPPLAQNIPLEILCQIFSDCLPSILLPSIFNTAPLNVSIVCRSWRAATLNTPSLWSTIRLSFSDMEQWFDWYRDRNLSMYKKLSWMWKLWMTRSQDSPLDFVLELHVDPVEEILAEARYIYQALLENQHRWRSVTIEYMNMTDDSDGDFCPIYTPSPLLEKMSGSIFHTSRETLVTYAVGLDVSACNRLECVSLKNSIQVAPVTFEMQRLRILKVNAANIDGLFTLLQYSPNLEVLKIADGLFGSLKHTNAPSVLTLPALTDMDLKSGSLELGQNAWIGLLLHHLRCPSLLNFKLIPPFEVDLTLILKNFLFRSRPSMERLFLSVPHGRRLGDEMGRYITAFLDILKISPGLLYLEIIGYLAARPEIIQSLAKNDPEGDGLCPLLTTTIESYDELYFQWMKMGNGHETSFPQL